MTKRASKAVTNALTPTPPYQQCVGANQYQPAPSSYGSSQGFSSQSVAPMPIWVNPPLDESWTPGPPPDTPSDYLHPEREDIASERMAAREET